MSSEVLGQGAKSDAGEEVDGESRVPRVVARHDALPGWSHSGVPSSKIPFVRE